MLLTGNILSQSSYIYISNYLSFFNYLRGGGETGERDFSD